MEVTRRNDADLYAEHAHELIVFARSLVGPDDAQDVLSEAFSSAIATPGWATVSNPRAYLYRSVYNRAQSHVQRAAARPGRELRAVRLQTPSTEPAMPDPTVLSAVEQLSTQQRAVIILTYWKDLPVAQVAELLGVSDGTVRKQLARARARLREVLDER